MAEIWFYHLERQTLDEVLPVLLERTLDRDWRAVVHVGAPDRLEIIDALLWTHRELSFLPHSMQRDGMETLQPVFLTCDDDNPNAANVRFLVEGAPLIDAASYDRLVYLFDGADEAALDIARSAWKQARATPHDTTYWRQSDEGRWNKQD